MATIASLSEKIIAYITASVKKGGVNSRGKTIQSKIDYAVFSAFRTARPGATPVVVVNLYDLIYNMVIAYVTTEDRKAKKTGKSRTERSYGTLLVTDSAVHQGWLQQEGKIVKYSTMYQVYTGEEVNYRREGPNYILEKAFTGAAKSQISLGDGAAGNVLARFGDEVEFAQLDVDFEANEATWESGATVSVPGGEHLWYKDDTTFALFDGSTYKEHAGYPSDPVFTVDCSAYFSAAAGGTGFTNGGISYTRFPGATKAMKILFYGKYRICIIARFYYSDNNVDFDDWSETGIFELLIIDSETEAILFTKTVTHSTWYLTVCPSGMYGGYPDIQIDKETGNLLLLTGNSPTTTTIGVKYYNEADPVTDPQIYDHTTNATVYRVPFDIDEVKINDAETDFELVLNRYSHNGVITSIDGVSVVGGITSTMFTQQPESYKLFVNRHMVAYKQEDTVPTTPEEVLIAYRLVAYGRWEFYDVTGAAVVQSTLSPHSTACGAVTTTAVADKAVAVVSYSSRWGLLVFIREWIPSRDRTAVTFQIPYYEHGGANYTGRPDSDTTYITAKGSTVVNRGYAAAEASYLNDDRFLVLTDFSDDKPIWLSRVLWLQTWDDNGTEASGTFQEQGHVFWKNDFEVYELPVLGSEISGEFTGTQRYRGNFLNKTDPTIVESTHGYNNCAQAQKTDDSIIILVSRAERVDYFDSDTQVELSPTEMNYDYYVLHMIAHLGGLVGIRFDGAATTIHNLVDLRHLEQMTADAALVELTLA